MEICNISVLPEITISPDSNVTVKIGRAVSIRCSISSVNGEDRATWYKIGNNGQKEPGR